MSDRSRGGFLWGAATSSHQVEGGNTRNDWAAFERDGHIEGGVRSGQATDHWNRFEEDLMLAAELGLGSYRFSIEWSRLEPEEGTWDLEAWDWYATLIATCERYKLKPMLTLHHFTTPLWLAAKGGFTHPESPARFGRFAAEAARRLGARVPLWCTLNEPMVLAVGAYLGRFMPPAQFSARNASLASANLLRAHVLAYEAIHREIPSRLGPWQSHPVEVGIAHNLLDFKPDRAWHPIERGLTALCRRFYNRAWLDAVTGRRQHFGIAGLVPYAKPVPEALGRVTADFLGINYYTKAYLQWRPRTAAPERAPELPVGISFARRKEEASDLEWAFHPRGLGRMIRFVRRYGLPIYITENGVADRDDRLRGRYIDAHLEQVEAELRRGADIRGYYHWSLLDNFEWIKGYGPRFGLYRVNYETFERSRNPSAARLTEWIEGGRMERAVEAKG